MLTKEQEKVLKYLLKSAIEPDCTVTVQKSNYKLSDISEINFIKKCEIS